SDLIDSGETNLALLGITPTYPSEKYGYIIPKDQEVVSRVSCFKEKPSAKEAEGYIHQGALWNAGIFAFKLGYIVNKAQEVLSFDGYNDLLSKYEQLPKISFDYAIVEKEPNIQVLQFDGEWKDVGTWNTLAETMSENVVGKATLSDTCSNVHIVNELDIPIFAMGLKDAIISASPDGIIVSDKVQSSYIKPYIDKIEQQVMYAEKSWGEYRVINVGKDSLTIRVTLNAGNKMNYHSHENRDETWVVISGSGKAVIDGKEQLISVGDVVNLPAGCKHTVSAETDMQLIEIQVGKDISLEDKQIYEFL
ncbi:MAG: sugar phosphate nucleotidyltransferase, partial [Bacillota bacterium]|nr:sugar phosphate nucleotidyltransferase [Bacillota bacterium]